MKLWIKRDKNIIFMPTYPKCGNVSSQWSQIDNLIVMITPTHIWILIAKTMNMTFLEVQGAQRDTMLCKGCQEEELGDEGGGGAQKLRAQLKVTESPTRKRLTESLQLILKAAC